MAPLPGTSGLPRWPRWVIAVAVVLVAATLALAVATVHYERKVREVRRQLSLAERTLPNRGGLAYDDGELLTLPGPSDVTATAAVVFAKVEDQRNESVWVLVRVEGLDPGVEFDLETQSCDGAVGFSLDKGAERRGATSTFHSAELGLPARGRSYNVVVRRYRGDPVVGLTVRWDRRVSPLPVGVRGC
jgi:hypothetical protein